MTRPSLRAASPSLAIEARRVFDGERMLGPRRVEIANGRISAVLDSARTGETSILVTLPPDVILAPGFIDIQVNGGGDVLLNDDPSLEAIAAIATAHRRFGTTGLLPTLITDHRDKMKALLHVAGEGMAIPGVLGFHLEGPHLNPTRKGIHPPQFIRPMDQNDPEALSAFGKFGQSLVTLAPERVPADIVRQLVSAGLVVSAGHSEATAADVAVAADHGMTGVTHLFNAMSQMTPRAPGLVGVALTDDRLMSGIIPDGIHVAPLNLKAAFRAIGRDRLMIITDAMPTSAGRARSFRLQGREILLKEGRLTDREGTLAGAHLTMIEAVRNAKSMMGASLEDALIMASGTPARFLGLDREYGRISKGFRANIVAFNDRFEVLDTWIDGAGAMMRTN